MDPEDKKLNQFLKAKFENIRDLPKAQALLRDAARLAETGIPRTQRGATRLPVFHPAMVGAGLVRLRTIAEHRSATVAQPRAAGVSR